MENGVTTPTLQYQHIYHKKDKHNTKQIKYGRKLNLVLPYLYGGQLTVSPRGLHPKGVSTLVSKIGGPALCNSLLAVWAAESCSSGLLWE